MNKIKALSHKLCKLKYWGLQPPVFTINQLPDKSELQNFNLKK